jgi:hypothetical protein
VGRSFTAYDYGEVLDRYAAPDRLRELTNALANRGAVVGYPFESTGGVWGWLDPAETAELAFLLSELPLPRLAPAVGEGRAVLWGNDVIPGLGKETYGILS